MGNGKMSTGVLIGIVFCILAGFFWGTTGVARALGPASATSLGVVAARVFVGGLALFVMCFFSGDFKKVKNLKDWPWFTLIAAGFCLGLFTLVYLESMKHAGVALGASISCASIPVLSMIFEVCFLKVRPSRWQVIGLFGCVIGGTMVSFFGSGSAGIGNLVLWGCLLALFSGVIFSGYSLLIQRAVQKGFPYNLSITGMFFFASLIWVPYALITQDMSWLSYKTETGLSSGIMMAIYIGIFSAAAGYFCYVRGIARVPVSIAVSLGMAEPLTATLLGVTILAEKLNGLTWLGMGILFIGIFVIGQATVAKNKKEAAFEEASLQTA